MPFVACYGNQCEALSLTVLVRDGEMDAKIKRSEGRKDNPAAVVFPKKARIIGKF